MATEKNHFRERTKMVRLIDANELEAKMEKRIAYLRKEYGDYDHYTDGYCEALDRVEDAHTVDAVEVVRCKDCTEWDEKEQECSHWYGFRADDFCSYGERKDNG